MKFEITKQGGRIITLTEDEKYCKICKGKDKELSFSQERKCLVCDDCMAFCQGPGIESQFFKIDKWVMIE